MRSASFTALVACLFLAQIRASPIRETFRESLDLKQLSDDRLSAHFEFTTTLERELSQEHDEPQHYRIFPLALGQLLLKHAVTELHLTLNAGSWNYASWGLPPDVHVASGASLWAWIGKEPDQDRNRTNWKGLTNSLAGLFCASLAGMDDRRTISPQVAFRPEGDLLQDIPHHLLYAALPSESVCTENLTPFLKLLPCKSSAGLASLLNPHIVFDADWHSVGVHVRWVEDDSNTGSGSYELKLVVGAVLDPLRLFNTKAWSLRSIFGRSISRSCLTADSSVIRISSPHHSEESYNLSPVPTTSTSPLSSTYDLSDIREPFDLSVKWANSGPSNGISRPSLPFSARRVLLGGQSRATLSVQVTNHLNTMIAVSWLENMLWFMNFYLHTLELRVNGTKVEEDSILQILTYTPPTSRRPTILESILRIPSLSTVHITLSLDKAFIKYTEHPPDAMRGWDLPGGVFTLLEPSSLSAFPPFDISPSNSSESEELRAFERKTIFTTTLLGDLPTPDFSMPYNVIIMTSTVFALFFGSIFNLLVRDWVWIRLDGDTKDEKTPGKT